MGIQWTFNSIPPPVFGHFDNEVYWPVTLYFCVFLPFQTSPCVRATHVLKCNNKKQKTFNCSRPRGHGIAHRRAWLFVETTRGTFFALVQRHFQTLFWPVAATKRPGRVEMGGHLRVRRCFGTLRTRSVLMFACNDEDDPILTLFSMGLMGWLM